MKYVKLNKITYKKYIIVRLQMFDDDDANIYVKFYRHIHIHK